MAFSKKKKDEDTSPQKTKPMVEMEEAKEADAEEEGVSMMDLLQTMMKSKKGSATPGVDGSHSSSPGPAPCGKKHWYQGKEVDYITRYAGKYMLGFNVDDNPLIVARDFVAKNNLNPSSTDNTQLITKIADMIRETIAEGGGEGSGELDVEKLIDGAKQDPYADDPIIRPYGEANGVTAVYNHETKQVDLIHYHNERDMEKLKAKSEKKQKNASKLQEDHDMYKKKKDQEMEETRRKILAMRQEQKSSSNTGATMGYVPKPTASGRGMASLRDLERGGVSGGGSVIGGSASGASSSNTKVKHKTEWDDKYMMERFRKGGSTQFIKDLEDAEFTDEEKAILMFKINAMMMYKKMDGDDDDDDDDDEDEGTSGFKMPRTDKADEVFKGEGHSLSSSAAPAVGIEGSNDSNNNNNNGSAALEEEDVTEVVVDKNSPTTQIRLAIPGRSPITAVFNLNHTVGDVRRYVNRNAPMGRPYHLQLLRPPTRLDDTTTTISAAKLEKSTITIVFV